MGGGFVEAGVGDGKYPVDQRGEQPPWRPDEPLITSSMASAPFRPSGQIQVGPGPAMIDSSTNSSFPPGQSQSAGCRGERGEWRPVSPGR